MDVPQVSSKETAAILELLDACCDVSGDVVELGCYKGDTSVLLARALAGSEKRLWLYDSFAGLPAKSVKDLSAVGTEFQAGELVASKRDLLRRFQHAGLPRPRVKKAFFNELGVDDLPTKISFAFLDGDLYESIKDSLALVFPRLSPGAIVVVHDYHNPKLPGVTSAVDEFLTRHPSVSLTVRFSLAILRPN